MLIHKDGRYHVGGISYAMPNHITKSDDFMLNSVYCFSIQGGKHDFEIYTEACYSKDDAKTYLHITFDDEEIEPLGEITPFSVNGLSGYYLDCFFPFLNSVHREFYFDLPDKKFNFFSVIIMAKNKKELKYALQSETVIAFFENLRIE